MCESVICYQMWKWFFCLLSAIWTIMDQFFSMQTDFLMHSDPCLWYLNLLVSPFLMFFIQFWLHLYFFLYFRQILVFLWVFKGPKLQKKVQISLYWMIILLQLWRLVYILHSHIDSIVSSFLYPIAEFGGRVIFPAIEAQFCILDIGCSLGSFCLCQYSEVYTVPAYS